MCIQIKEDEMGRACSTLKDDAGFLQENQELKTARKTDVGVKTLFRWISKNLDGLVWTKFVWLNEVRGFSPRANYTDGAVAACRRS
jgi:hypothetical protein